MTSRERVLTTLNHKEPDRIPIDFGAMRSTGIMAVEYNRLKAHLGHHQGETFVYDLMQQLAEPEPWILKLFSADVEQLHRLRPAFGYSILNKRAGVLPDGSPCIYPADFQPQPYKEGEALFAYGQPFAYRPESSYVFYAMVHPLSGARDTGEIDQFTFPTIDDDEFQYLSWRSKQLRESTDRAILGAFGGNVIESGQFDFGYDEFLMLMATEPLLVHHYFDRLTEHWIQCLDRYIEAVGDNIDIIQVGDDLGTQHAPVISPKMYREMVKPYHQRIYQHIKAKSKYHVFLHTCGAISELIPDLIEAGVDILNPVQTSAEGMAPESLKRSFGNDVVFWGGGCETQTTLFQGTPQDVKREAKERLAIFGAGGGYVFTQIHNILVGVPPENVVALYEAAQEC